MIQEEDVDVFLKAKRDQKAIEILQLLSSLSLAALIILAMLEFPYGYVVFLATTAWVFMEAATRKSKWVAVSRDQLLQTFENIINKDPDALKILAEKRRDDVAVRNLT